jgi:hypothetical protein
VLWKTERISRLKWGWNKSPFDINSIAFHFDDFNYGRRSQPYFFLIIATELFFCMLLNLLYTRTTPSLFIEVSELSQEGSFIFRDIEFTHFYDFSIEFWNCSDSVIYIFSFYYRLWKKNSSVAIIKKKYGCGRGCSSIQ